MTLKLGVLGVGYLGRFHALKAAKGVRHRLIGVADADPARASSVAIETGAPPLTIDGLIAASDAVLIASPTRFHAELATKALNAGKHVLVEKPITPTLAEADALIELAAKKNLILQVGHIERFSAGVATLLEAPGAFGRPLYMEATRIAPFRPRGLDVSVVLDLMIHDLDLVMTLANSPLASVDAVGATVFSDHPDIANARLRFANGTVATITASRMALKLERKLRIFGTEGHVSVDFVKRELHAIQKGTPEETHATPVEALPGCVTGSRAWTEHDAMEAEQAAFASACLDGLPSPVPGEAGRAALEAALLVEAAIRQSLAAAGLPETGRFV
ncbi:Gfo/Idh/MocA family oxidoreductase [Acetobacteraceae bacterium H6797]|nr:Gfo/Idh/MocA family oxidoreductase [Acetobacteraceae bacterium H6797]